MRKETVILIAEDDEGHAALIKSNLSGAGIVNNIVHFKDGQEILDFLFAQGDGPRRQADASYVLLLDIRMPKLDGIDVLEKIKADPELCKIPVIMVTTTDNPLEVERCHALGCSNYIAKPVNYEKFTHAIRQLGLFLTVVEVPRIHSAD